MIFRGEASSPDPEGICNSIIVIYISESNFHLLSSPPMKKFVLLFALFSFLFSLNEALAYTQADIANAQFLSDK
jgi:hypothetical protein